MRHKFGDCGFFLPSPAYLYQMLQKYPASALALGRCVNLFCRVRLKKACAVGRHGMFLSCVLHFWRMRQILAIRRKLCERIKELLAARGNFHYNTATNEGTRKPSGEEFPRIWEENDACGKKRPNATIFRRTVWIEFHLKGNKLTIPANPCVHAPYYYRIRQKESSTPKTTQRKRPRPAKTWRCPASFLRIHQKILPRAANFGKKLNLRIWRVEISRQMAHAAKKHMWAAIFTMKAAKKKCMRLLKCCRKEVW